MAREQVRAEAESSGAKSRELRAESRVKRGPKWSTNDDWRAPALWSVHCWRVALRSSGWPERESGQERREVRRANKCGANGKC